MKNRRGFLTALTAASGAGLTAVMAAKDTAARADATAAAHPARSQTPPPTHSPSEKASPAALAVAATFRAFDPRLSDDELAHIAREIDANRAAGAALNSKTKPLRNGDEMVARFAADERVRS